MGEHTEERAPSFRSTVSRFRRFAARVPKRVNLEAQWQRASARRMRFAWRRANVAMLHPGRCGSTVVGEMLNDHAKISWAGEIFEGVELPSPGEREVRARIERSAYANLAPVYGFETKYLPQHLAASDIGMDLAAYLELLRAMRFSKFILLHRKNYLRRAVSTAVARSRGEWHSTAAPTQAARVHLEVEAFQTGNSVEPLVDAFRRMDNSYASARELLRDDEVLHLEYESDIADDPKQAYSRVCGFVGVTPAKPRVKLQKTNPFAYEEIIDNLDEVRSVLAGTPYAWMLDN